MRIHSIASAVGLLALGIVLTMSENVFAQSASAPFVQSAVITSAVVSDTSNGLSTTVPLVPVKWKRHWGWYGDWGHWSDPHDWYHHWYEGRHSPEYRFRRGWRYGPSYTCWSDGWRTYCGYF